MDLTEWRAAAMRLLLCCEEPRAPAAMRLLLRGEATAAGLGAAGGGGLGAGGRGGGLGAGRPIAWGRQWLREESEMRDGETERERLDEARVRESCRSSP